MALFSTAKVLLFLYIRKFGSCTSLCHDNPKKVENQILEKYEFKNSCTVC